MDDAPFELSERTRQFLAAGMRYFLCDPAEAGLWGKQAAPGARPIEAARPETRGTRPVAAPGLAAGPGDESSDAIFSQAQRMLQTRPWRDFIAKLPAAPKTLWTYEGYARDVFDPSVPKTRGLWQTVIGSLNAPRGTIGFFPCALESGRGVATYPHVFFGLVKRVRPQSLVVYGAEAFEELRRCSGSSQYGFLRDIAMHKAPSPEELLALESEALTVFIAELRRLLLL